MSKQNTKKITEWKAANITRLNLEIKKDSDLIPRLQQALDLGLAKSRQAYIIEAVKQRLDADGIPEPKPSAPPEGTP